MATKLPDALSWDQYKSREPLPTAGRGTYQRPLTDENRHEASPDEMRSAPVQDDYAGNDPMPPLPERISIIPLTKSSSLNIQEITSRMDESTAQKAAMQKHTAILEAGGAPALKLIRDAAIEGNKATIRGRELGQDGHFTVVGSHTGYALATSALVASALEIAPPTREDAQTGKTKVDAHHEESIGKTVGFVNLFNVNLSNSP